MAESERDRALPQYIRNSEADDINEKDRDGVAQATSGPIRDQLALWHNLEPSPACPPVVQEAARVQRKHGFQPVCVREHDQCSVGVVHRQISVAPHQVRDVLVLLCIQPTIGISAASRNSTGRAGEARPRATKWQASVMTAWVVTHRSTSMGHASAHLRCAASRGSSAATSGPLSSNTSRLRCGEGKRGSSPLTRASCAVVCAG